MDDTSRESVCGCLKSAGSRRFGRTNNFFCSLWHGALKVCTKSTCVHSLDRCQEGYMTMITLLYKKNTPSSPNQIYQVCSFSFLPPPYSLLPLSLSLLTTLSSAIQQQQQQRHNLGNFLHHASPSWLLSSFFYSTNRVFVEQRNALSPRRPRYSIFLRIILMKMTDPARRTKIPYLLYNWIVKRTDACMHACCIFVFEE